MGIEALNSPKSWKDVFEIEKSGIYCLKIEAIKALVKLTSLFANNPSSYEHCIEIFMKILASIIDYGLLFLKRSIE